MARCADRAPGELGKGLGRLALGLGEGLLVVCDLVHEVLDARIGSDVRRDQRSVIAIDLLHSFAARRAALR